MCRRAILGIDMASMSALRGKRVAVMGLGVNRGGLGVARFLARAGARVLVTDLKSADTLASSLRELRRFRNITYVFGEHREQDFIDTDLVVQNPGVPRNSKYLAIAKEHGVPITTDVGLFLDACPSERVIAVTGTKGKSTTSSLIAAMLRRARRPTVLAGNIGVSVLDALAEITPDTWVVLELSSWQIEGITGVGSPHPLYSPSPFDGEGEGKGERRRRGRVFAPHVAVITNIMADHLDRYASFEEYADVKRSLVAHQRETDIAVLNADDARVAATAKRTHAEVCWFGKRRGTRVANGWIVARTEGAMERIIPVREIPIPGDHNVANVLAAVTAARAIGISPTAIRSAVHAFRGVPHRLEDIRTFRGVRFVNDSAATTPDATLAALRAFDQPIVLICGGKNKDLDYRPLVRALRNAHVRQIILLDHPAYTASLMIQSAAPRALAKKIVSASHMRDAVRLAAEVAERGGIVLLSPGAASFGMFTNEFDRGDQFRDAVRAL